MSSNLPHPFALTIFEDLMIWTDWHTKSISAANKITGKGFRTIHDRLHFPMDIHSYHPARQPTYTNRCVVDKKGLKGGCSHLCLPNKETRRCRCPIGLTLKDDQYEIFYLNEKKKVCGKCNVLSSFQENMYIDSGQAVVGGQEERHTHTSVVIQKHFG